MDETTQDKQEPSTPQALPRKDLRARLRRPLMLLGLVVVLAVAAYYYLSGGRFEETDDAYVQAAQVAISADVAGRVKEIAVRDNQLVHKGDVLFRLDDAPFRIAVDAASAQLAAARLKVEMLKANYRQRQADLVSAQDTLKFAQTEYERERRLSASGIASQSQVDQALHAFDEARTQLGGIKQQISAVVANLAGNPDISLKRHPEVQQAQALLDRAKLNLSYTVVKAPTEGVVARVEELQVGNYINAAAPVFALVSTRDVWIEANFKEDQLAHMLPGQTATVKIDSYPGKTFEGRVASISPGTGSQFSVLPAENATGNWVKVVQRLPVRIELDRLDPATFPLQGGLSADVSVDTRHRRHLFGAVEASSANTSGGST
ncbi:hemolysin D [Sulfuriferula plumbiphila]|uniref:Hemolysin D n=1 Tax=Sulfuriferula plumbiphila TaxID=171865 RepID=A0A512L679_9PROT|nr:HlyD family secretion protein [Sulfuriferula plumbiphila]BBP03584.1 hemolysin D [Sulfuriferula plumbiphila]GEP29985.1 hemolysin D [Sulfuriferula plumbiphila]